MKKRHQNEFLDRRIIKLLKDRKLTIPEIADNLKLSRRDTKSHIHVLRQKHYVIGCDKKEDTGEKVYFLQNEQYGRVFISSAYPGEKQFLFGATGDWHFGTKTHQPEAFHDSMKRLIDEGVKIVFAGGDLIDGCGVYRGQMENLRFWSVEDQVDHLAENLERYNGQLEFRGISGNHDYSFTQSNGIRPLKLLEDRVKCFHFDGDMRADYTIGGLCLRQVHGAGGGAYAKSYPAQKYIRNMLEGGLDNLPDILLMSHYHFTAHIPTAGIQVIHVGHLSGKENEFLIRRGLRGPMGVYTLDFKTTDGKISEFNPRWLEWQSNGGST